MILTTKRVDSTTKSAPIALTQKPSFIGNRTKYEKYLLTNVGGGACKFYQN